jgi:hypothetical protein
MGALHADRNAVLERSKACRFVRGRGETKFLHRRQTCSWRLLVSQSDFFECGNYGFETAFKFAHRTRHSGDFAPRGNSFDVEKK